MLKANAEQLLRIMIRQHHAAHLKALPEEECIEFWQFVDRYARNRINTLLHSGTPYGDFKLQTEEKK